MDISRAWKILGIEETKNEEEIVAAYRSKVIYVNPEDDAEGFKQLREAYETAVAYINRPDEEEEQEIDDTPIGRLIAEAKELYNDLFRRIDVRNWKEILSDPLCTDLDTADDAREAFLVFLLDNYYLPHEVFAEINNTFNMNAEFGALTEMFPRDFLEYVMFHVKEEDFFEYDKIYTREDYLSLYEGIDEKPYRTDAMDTFDKPEYLSEVDSYLREASTVLQAIDYMNEQDLDTEEREARIKKADGTLAYMQDAPIWHPFEYVFAMRILFAKGEYEKAAEMAEFVVYKDGLGVNDLLLKSTAAYILVKIQYDKDPHSTGDLDTDKIWQTINKVLAVRERFVQARIDKTILLTLEGNYDDANEEVLDVLDTNTRNNEAIVLLRYINEQIVSDYLSRLETEPDNIQYKMRAAWGYFRTERNQEAVDLLKSFEPDDEEEYSYHNMLGRCLYNTEDFEESAVELEKWRELLKAMEAEYGGKPADAIPEKIAERLERVGFCHYMLGDTYSKIGRDEDAMTEMSEAVKFTEAHVKDIGELLFYQETLGKMYHNAKRYPEAMDIWNSMIERISHCVPGYVNRQETAFEMRDSQLVIDDFFNIVADVPNYARAYVLALKVFNIFAREDGIDQVYAKAQENEVESDMIDFIVACSYRRRARYDEAGELLDKVIVSMDREETDIEDKAEVYAEKASLCYDLANRNVEDRDAFEGWTDKCREALEEGRKYSPDNKRIYWIETDLYEIEGKDATPVYEKMMELFPNDANVNYEFGCFLRRVRKAEDAETQFNMALKIDPEHSRANNMLARILMSKYSKSEMPEHYKMAVDYATRQLVIDPDAYYYVERALIYIDGYEFEKAIEDAKSALEKETDNIYAYNAAGYANMMLRRFDEAEEFLLKSIDNMETPDETPNPYINLARTYEMARKYDKALEYVDKKMEIFGVDNENLNRKGVIYKKAGRLQEAYDTFNIVRGNLAEKKKNSTSIWVDAEIVDNYLDILRTAYLMDDQAMVDTFHQKIADLVKARGFMSLFSEKKLSGEEKDLAMTILPKVAKHFLFVARDYKMSLKYLQKSLQIIESFDNEFSYAENADYADIYLDMASCYRRLDKNDKAEECARKALRLYSVASSSFDNYINYPKTRVMRRQDVAYAKFLVGEEEEAVKIAESMADYPQCRFCRHSICYERYLNIARFFEAKHEYDKALEYYLKAQELGNDDSEVVVSIKAMKERVGDRN